MDEIFNKTEPAPIQNSGKRIRPENDPLNRFSWDTAPKFLVDMVERVNSVDEKLEMKGFVEQVARELLMTPAEQKNYLRPDPVPYDYRLNWAYLAEQTPVLKENAKRGNVNPTGLTIEQILAQDRHFHRTYRNNNTAAQILSRHGCTEYASWKKWEIKHHKLTDYGWPKFTKTFHELGYIDVGPEGVKHEGMGWGAAYEIPFTTVDMAAGGIYDPEYWLLYFLAEKMGRFGNQRLWLGGAGENTADSQAPSLTGLVNLSGAVSLTSPSTDYGFSGGKTDFEDCFQDALRSWYGNSVFGSNTNIWVTTPGIGAEATNNDSTVGDLKTLTQQLQHKWFQTGEMTEWWIDKDIVATTVSSMTKTTQKYVFFKASPRYVKRTVVYPLQRKILSEKHKTYPDDIAFAYITGDILQCYDTNSIIVCGSSAKCQATGWRLNGLFMSASEINYRAFRPPVRT